eukprot:3525905-Lingulodinium_polyedra.AAC.1
MRSGQRAQPISARAFYFAAFGGRAVLLVRFDGVAAGFWAAVRQRRVSGRIGGKERRAREGGTHAGGYVCGSGAR